MFNKNETKRETDIESRQIIVRKVYFLKQNDVF